MHGPPLGCKPQVPLVPQVAGAVQSALVVQVFTQASTAQRPGAQFITAAATQVPVPLQVDAGARVDAVGQLAATHWLPDAQRAHCPAAHWPLVPHVACAWTAHLPWGSVPLATLVQLPTVPGRLQAWQAFPHALLQQTPCAQNELPHSLFAEQAAPGGLGPHELMLPFIPQLFGEMQSPVLVQAEKHLVALQW